MVYDDENSKEVREHLKWTLNDQYLKALAERVAAFSTTKKHRRGKNAERM